MISENLVEDFLKKSSGTASKFTLIGIPQMEVVAVDNARKYANLKSAAFLQKYLEENRGEITTAESVLKFIEKEIK